MPPSHTETGVAARVGSAPQWRAGARAGHDRGARSGLCVHHFRARIRSKCRAASASWRSASGCGSSSGRSDGSGDAHGTIRECRTGPRRAHRLHGRTAHTHCFAFADSQSSASSTNPGRENRVTTYHRPCLKGHERGLGVRRIAVGADTCELRVGIRRLPSWAPDQGLANAVSLSSHWVQP